MPKRKAIYSSEDLREDLECPVCLLIPKKGPIYQCESGHIHCQTCHSRGGLRLCSICRGPLGNTRNLVLEKIIAKLPTKCKFTEYGCLEEEKLPEEMIRHEQICNFRGVRCFFPRCNEIVTMPDLYDHIKMKHDYAHNYCSESDLTVNFKLSKDLYRPNMVYDPWFMRTKKHTFVTRLVTNNQTFFQFFVYILGSKDDIDEEEYSFHIDIKSSISVCIK